MSSPLSKSACAEMQGPQVHIYIVRVEVRSLSFKFN